MSADPHWDSPLSTEMIGLFNATKLKLEQKARYHSLGLPEPPAAATACLHQQTLAIAALRNKASTYNPTVIEQAIAQTTIYIAGAARVSDVVRLSSAQTVRDFLIEARRNHGQHCASYEFGTVQ